MKKSLRLVDEPMTRIETLKKSEKAIKSICTSIGEGFWDLGAFASVIHGQELYKDAGFKTWASYCKERLGYSVVTVDNAMKVEKTMTREKAGTLGCRLASAIAKAPEESRPKLLKLVASGVEKKTVEKLATKKAAEKRVADGVARSPGRPVGKKHGKCAVCSCEGGCMLTLVLDGMTVVVRVKGDNAEWEVV
jgi:hypothetical protein